MGSRPPPRRTGHADFPHPALAKDICKMHSQLNQSYLLSVEAVLLLLLGLLTQLLSPSGKCRRQKPFVYPSQLHRFSRPRYIQSAVHSSDSARLTLKPLRSTGITPLHHYYELLRLPLAAACKVIDSLKGLSALPTPRRASQVPDCSFRTRRLLSPRRALPVLTTVTSQQMLASPHPKGWPLSCFRVTRLNQVRLRYGSCVCLPRLRRRNCSRSPLGLLHVQRLIHMTDSFHSVRNSQALLGAPDEHGWTRIGLNRQENQERNRRRM